MYRSNSFKFERRAPALVRPESGQTQTQSAARLEQVLASVSKREKSRDHSKVDKSGVKEVI